MKVRIAGLNTSERGHELVTSEWPQLQQGTHVLVQRNGGPILLAEVDELVDDASVFWVWLDGGRGRVAIYVDEGTSVWMPATNP